MFAEFLEEGEKEPAAYSRYEGSYEEQNARAEIIPVWQFKGLLFVGPRMALLTFEPVSTFLGWRCRQSCSFARVVEIEYLDSIVKSAI
jgi:hypothetical protein